MPEILLVNQVLLGEAIKKAPSVWPHLRDYNELVHGRAAGVADRGKLLDVPYDADNTGFIGNGRHPKGVDLEAAKVRLLLSDHFFYSIAASQSRHYLVLIAMQPV